MEEYFEYQILLTPPRNRFAFFWHSQATLFSATQISPLGYYTFGTGEMGGEGEEEEEEKPGGDDKTSYTENPKYDAPALRDLIDGSMSFWVHHSQYILPQGFNKLSSYLLHTFC